MSTSLTSAFHHLKPVANITYSSSMRDNDEEWLKLSLKADDGLWEPTPCYERRCIDQYFPLLLSTFQVNTIAGWWGWMSGVAGFQKYFSSFFFLLLMVYVVFFTPLVGIFSLFSFCWVFSFVEFLACFFALWGGEWRKLLCFFRIFFLIFCFPMLPCAAFFCSCIFSLFSHFFPVIF